MLEPRELTSTLEPARRRGRRAVVMAKHTYLPDERLREEVRPAAMVLRQHMRELTTLQSVVALPPEATVRSLWRWGRRGPAVR